MNRKVFIYSNLALLAAGFLSSFREKISIFTNRQRCNLLLGRVSDKEATVNLYIDQDASVFIEYGLQQNKRKEKTPIYNLTAFQPVNITMRGLKEDQRYTYQIFIKTKETTDFSLEKTSNFCTRKKHTKEFIFTITADSHLGTIKHCDPALYQLTLNNLSKDNPDLHFALGDDFRTSKIRNQTYKSVEQLYFDQREHLDTVFHSIPYFFILGNHELEAKAYDNNTSECLAAWSEKARKLFIPNPDDNTFFSGNAEQQNYYAFEWGEVLFITLDVFRYSNYSSSDEEMKEKNKENMQNLSKEERMKIRADRQNNKEDKKGKRDGEKKDRWDFTLGEEQYQWLKNTLESSKARYKFVLGHHVMGSCRGGVECAGNFEWGGDSKKGNQEFELNRPGWKLPIHDLMTSNKVTAFIQGHDHLFARQEKDGLAYITCPMCGDPGYNTYNADAYTTGDKLSNSGHLRFSVTEDDVKMDYIKAVLEKDESQQGKNGTVAYSWSFSQNKKIT